MDAKPFRWTAHAKANLSDREIDPAEAHRTLHEPQVVLPGRQDRRLYVRRYFDRLLAQDMLLCGVIEETMEERVVVTMYKTSQIQKYLTGAFL